MARSRATSLAAADTMARARLAFRQTDMTRAVRAVEAAGKRVARVEVDRDGKIVVIVGEPSKTEASGEGNEWDAA
jgi:hypothetical protein